MNEVSLHNQPYDIVLSFTCMILDPRSKGNLSTDAYT
jgi:hypothetical protein